MKRILHIAVMLLLFPAGVSAQTPTTTYPYLYDSFIEGCVVMVIKRSILKKTLLLVFNSTCFTLKDNLAKEIVVNYA